MQLHASVQPAHLTVQYQHTHEGDGAIYLYNHLFDWFGVLAGDLMKGAAFVPNQKPTSALAAVFAHGPDGVLLEQGLPPPLPPGINAFAPRVPLCQRLMPGETATVTMRLPLPLDEWHPNEPPTPARAWPGPVSTLTMKVVYAEERHASLVREHPTFRGLYNVTAHPLGELRTAVALAAPISLRRRTDPFYRAT
jgi:hypothetical protein